MAHQISMFCKSFNRDFDRLKQLLRTYREHNKDNIPFLLSLPAQQISDFKNIEDVSDLTIVTDEELVGYGQQDPVGWTYQQLVKLCCDQINFADAFLCVDSDFYFCKDFTRDTFLDSRGRPFIPIMPFSSGISSSNPHMSELAAYIKTGKYRDFTDQEWTSLRSGQLPDLSLSRDDVSSLVNGTNLSRLFRRPAVDYHNMPGPIMEAEVLAEMRERLLPQFDMKKPGHFANLLICTSPWENFWYYEYLLASDREFTRKPLYFTGFMAEKDLDLARSLSINIEQVAERYLGVAMAAGHYDATYFG